MRLQTSKYFCYAETAGRSGGRLCWRATCQGITRCSSSRRCAWDGKLNTSRPSHNIGLIDCPCLKKRIFNAVDSHGADYLNQNGRSPFAAEPRQRATPALVFDSHGLRLPSYTNLPLKCMSEAILLENFYRNRFLYINFGEFFLCIVAITKHEPEHETLISDVTGLFVIGSEAFLSATNPGGTERATP